jgi:hypothetical protein
LVVRGHQTLTGWLPSYNPPSTPHGQVCSACRLNKLLADLLV